MTVARRTMGTRLLNQGESIRSALYRFYVRSEQRIAPRLRSSQYAYYEALRSVLTKPSRWVDLGCGHQVFADWMTREQQEVIDQSGSVAGIDLDIPSLRQHTGIRRRVTGDLSRLPFASGVCDVISANMVMEHLEDPARVLNEVHRALAPGGTFVFHTPNYYHWSTLVAAVLPDRLKKTLVRFLDGRREQDVFKTHYRINTPAGVRRLAQQCGFEVVALTMVSSSAMLQMLGPVVALELVYIRLLEHPSLAQLRSNMVVVLRKPAAASMAAAPDMP